MARREVILFILANMGSILGQISTPENRDKAEVLRCRRGVSELNKWVQAWEPSSAKPERVQQNIPLPDKDEKSKMLENLRIMITPYTKQKKQQVLTQSNWDGEYRNREQNTENWNANTTTEENTEVLWDDPTATPITTLQPESSNLTMKENENGTCDWRRRQPQDFRRTGQDALQELMKKEESELSIDNVGQKLHNFWKCIQSKYWISYAKIKKKVCSWFGGKSQESSQTTKQPHKPPTDTTTTTTVTTKALTTRRRRKPVGTTTTATANTTELTTKRRRRPEGPTTTTTVTTTELTTKRRRRPEGPTTTTTFTTTELTTKRRRRPEGPTTTTTVTTTTVTTTELTTKRRRRPKGPTTTTTTTTELSTTTTRSRRRRTRSQA